MLNLTSMMNLTVKQNNKGKKVVNKQININDFIVMQSESWVYIVLNRMLTKLIDYIQ